jgi:hypothetical protein
MKSPSQNSPKASSALTEDGLLDLFHSTETPPPVTVMGNDYSYEGWVVMVGYKRDGAFRCVVEDINKRLFIHNAGQVRSR